MTLKELQNAITEALLQGATEDTNVIVETFTEYENAFRCKLDEDEFLILSEGMEGHL